MNSQNADEHLLDHRRGSRCGATRGPALPISVLVLSSVLWVALAPAADREDAHAVRGVSRCVDLQGPGNTGAVPCDVVQILDASGEPHEYFMDVDSVVCGDAQCEIVTVRIHFDPLGNYVSYELPSGGNLTKWGHKPFSIADHKNLHRILSDPYSPLKSIAWDQITVPQSPAEAGDGIDGISGATMLSKRNVVVVGAAYTCCTLWHWSHGEVGDVIREMTIRASDEQDLLRYVRGGDDEYVVFATDQLRRQGLFDTKAITTVLEMMHRHNHQLINPALKYLERASSETGVDYFFRCREDKELVADSIKRVRFLEALRDTDLEPPTGYLPRLASWLEHADSYYEVHLLLSLLERDDVASDDVVSAVMSLLDSDNPLVVSRSRRYLEAQELNDSQQERFKAFE